MALRLVYARRSSLLALKKKLTTGIWREKYLKDAVVRVDALLKVREYQYRNAWGLQSLKA
jgi:hypothetical protein